MKLLIGIVVCALATVSLARQAPPAKPNIVFILIDDMGYGDLSCFDKDAPPTPRIDQLASEGIRFTQYYSNAPICSPSRAAFLTGQYPQRWRISSFLDGRHANEKRGVANWLDPAAPSFVRELRKSGYATGHFGKWHLGGGRDVGDAPLITEYGFDRSLTQFEGLGDRLLILMDRFDGSQPEKNGLALASEKLGRGKTQWVDRSTVTARFAAAAIAFIDEAQQAGKPFFVNLWLDDVHSPFFPPKELRKEGGKRAMYRAVVQAMDAQLAPLLDKLKTDPALRDNTIVLLTSDNGPEPGAGSAGPFRGTKTNLYEGGVREPFIVWAPGLIESTRAGTTNDRSVIVAMDLAPSLLDLAGVTSDGNADLSDAKPDGHSVAQTLLGRAEAIRETPIFWRRPPDRPGTTRDPFPDLAMRQGDWKLLCMADGSSPQLYDLSKDIREADNLAEQAPDRVRKMTDAVRAWNATLPADKPRAPAQGE